MLHDDAMMEFEKEFACSVSPGRTHQVTVFLPHAWWQRTFWA